MNSTTKTYADLAAESATLANRSLEDACAEGIFNAEDFLALERAEASGDAGECVRCAAIIEAEIQAVREDRADGRA